jgi:hypothetical protein
VSTQGFFLTFGTLFGYTGHAPTTDGGRLFALTYMFFCLITISAYTANLASIITISAEISGGINKIDDLILARRPVCVLANTAYGSWLKTSSIWRKGGESEMQILGVERSEQMTQFLQEKKCDGVIDRDMVRCT